MIINDHLAHKLAHQRVRENLEEAERNRLIKLASLSKDETHQVRLILKQVKNRILNLLGPQDKESADGARRTGSLPKSSST